MNRPRKRDRHLPACVYKRGPSLYYVKRGHWTRLGPADDLRGCLAEYARLQDATAGTMAELIEDMLPRITQGRAPATVKLYTQAARKLQYVFAEFAPHEVMPRHVGELKRDLAATPQWANRCMSVLRMVFAEAFNDQLVESNPCVGVKRHPPSKRTRRLTQREYDAIYREASERLRLVMDLCFLTGQRIGDVLHIRRSDCVEEGIYFQPRKTANSTAVRIIIGWTPQLRAAVDAAKRAHGRIVSQWLVKGDKGRPLAYQPIWRDWKAACAAAKVDGATIHDLRAMAASEAKKQGKDAQALLAHSSERMTAGYLRDRDVVVVQGPVFATREK